MTILEPVTKFLFDPKPRLTTKAAIVIFIILGIVLADNIFGYSYFYNSSKKIEQLEKLNSILKDSSIDPSTRMYAETLRKKVMERSNIVERIIPVVRDINFQKVVNNSPEGNRNNFWFHVTSAGLFYLMAILAIPALIFEGSNAIIQDIAGTILRVIGILAVGLFLYWLFSFIPPISNSTWLWNYILNFILQIGIIAIGIKITEDGGRII